MPSSNPERLKSIEVPFPMLTIRCLVEGRADHWQAFSLELGLAAQGESETDAKRKLADMIASYVYDALVGEDKEHAELLLTRRATIGIYAKYYKANILSRLRRGGDGHNGERQGTYRNPLPVAPVGCAA
ncbi:MAG TPA: hypothetical protein VMU56_06530 [Beijerinckiaceae bacterium]|nr:hypothetical protein [Beijerinckiaceae bacterium]